MMRALKEQSIALSASEKRAPEESAGKIVRGVLTNRELPEYTERYEQIIGRAKELAEVPLESETELAAPPITKWAECGSSSRDEEDKRFEIRLAGEGGQGLSLAGLILAEAATIYDGKKATQTNRTALKPEAGPASPK